MPKRKFRAQWAWLWLILRVGLGVEWLLSGWNKLAGPRPFDASGFLQGAVAKAAMPVPPGGSALVQPWWAHFLHSFAIPHVGLFNVLVPWGEFLVGVALVLGCVTTFAAVMGMVLNFAYLLSGSVGRNPNFLVVEVLLVTLGGAYAGYWGLDRWVRPLWERTSAAADAR